MNYITFHSEKCFKMRNSYYMYIYTNRLSLMDTNLIKTKVSHNMHHCVTSYNVVQGTTFVEFNFIYV